MISVKIGNVVNAKGVVKADFKAAEGASVYDMVVLKDGKIVPNSYYDEATGKMVFAIDGSGNYTIENRSYKFGDTKEHWAENIISYLAVRGLVNGVGNNNFAPGKNVTRAEFLKMLLSATGINPETTDVTATDVKPDDWYAPTVEFALKNGIVSGYKDGSFKPNKEISREEMMVMLNNYMKYLGIESVKGQITFTDKKNISDWAVTAVQNVTSLGLITGYSDGSLSPLDKAIRAESAAIMMKCIKLLTEHLK